MTPEQIAQQKSQLTDDILNPRSSTQTKLLAIDALWALARLEVISEVESELFKKKEPHY